MLLIPIFFLSVTVATLVAQEPLASPAPLLNASATVASAGTNAVSLLAAQRAQALGFSSAAAELYRELLAQPGGDRAQLTLDLATALLDEGRIDEAREVLDGFAAPKAAAWKLRSALVLAQQRKFDEARTVAAGVKGDELPPDDRGWGYFLQGVLADAAGDLGKARGFYEQAEGAATSEMAKARFMLAREQARLKTGPVDAALAEEARKNMERLQGRKAGYGFARTYAAMLDSLGKKSEAVAVLQKQLLVLPAEERTERDDFRLLLGLISGAQSGAGRAALEELLDKGADRTKQRVALQLLAKASDKEPARAQFRRELDRLIDDAKHPVREDLLLVRAQVALAAKDYPQAEADARKLLEEFPGTQLKAQAYGVLTGSAWEQRRYRAAADLATKAKDELNAASEMQIRAELGVLVAEAWFRARDFPNAADAYSSVLREVPAGVSPGDLMFQRVLSDVEGGRLDVAQQQIEMMAGDPRFDVVNRWQAEWNLARALQVNGQTAEAYARVVKLLAEPATEKKALPPELKARMAWLQARLSLQAGQPAETLRLADTLSNALEGISAQLARQISSSGALLKAEANFKLGKQDEAVELLQKLRTDFPGSDAAIYSFIVEAGYYAEQDQTVKAQSLYTKLADEYPGNVSYAPYARFQAALQAERRGQDANLVEANLLIERLVKDYPQSPLVFYARLKQGDLLRKLNQFPQAQQAYENLVNNFPNHQDVILAQLALAECHNAQSMDDTDHSDRAITLFEHLRDRVDAPVDVRVEAGFNLGYLMARRGLPGRAEAVWWRDVVTTFLLDKTMAAELGAKGRYWMTRSLLELGALYEQQSKLDQARDAWSLIISAGLPGAALANDRLARFKTPTTNP